VLIEYGQFSGQHDEFLVPTAAIVVALNRTLQQLIAALPPPTHVSAKDLKVLNSRRANAERATLGALAQAARDALISESAGIMKGTLILPAQPSSVTGPSAVSRYQELLQAAHNSSGAPIKQQVGLNIALACHHKTSHQFSADPCRPGLLAGNSSSAAAGQGGQGDGAALPRREALHDP
jgi:hypothetical protein